MSVIHPGLFVIMQRFPEHKGVLRQLYLNNKYFRSTCNDYKKCSEALQYWTQSEHKEALIRYQEYSAIFNELESEIIQYLDRLSSNSK